MKFQAPSFLDRLAFAADVAQARHRIEGGQAGLAKALSRESGEEIGQSGLSKWLKPAGNRPSLEHIAALARLAGVDPGWLAMGELSLAPAPEAYLPVRVEVVTPESIAETRYRDELQQAAAEKEEVPTAPVVIARTYEEQRAAAKKKIAPKRRARGGG